MKIQNLKQSIILLLLSYLINSSVEHSTTDSLDVFSDGSYVFTWSIDHTAGTIKVDLDVKTTGWVGIGLSQDGQMSNSDVIMCYYSSKQTKAICQDSWADSRLAPPADTSKGGQDNLSDITGNVTNGRTKISFLRKLNTGDSKDLEVVKGKNMNVIFSYRENGNPDSENGQFLQHTRFSSKLILLYPSDEIPIIPNPNTESDAYSIKITYNNYQIPSDKTTYTCKYYDLNSLIRQQTQKANNITYHAIKFNPIIENQDLVHHMILYGCNVKNVQLSEDYFECSNMPAGCDVFTWGWAPGTGTFILPQEAGIVWGTYDTSKVLLQIHYDNQNAVSGKKDNSGVEVSYTTKLRTYDSGVLITGRYQDDFEIPPGQTAYDIAGNCGADCTKNLMGDINVFAYIFHGHKLLRKIKTSFNKPDGTEDFSWVENNYSFDHQRIYMLDSPVRLSKGFSATTVCTYNTENLSTVTKGGESTENEMCYNFIQYYPRENAPQSCFTTQAYNYCTMNDKIERVLSGFNHSLNLLLIILLALLF